MLPNICGIQIDASASATPSVGPSLQPFYNTYIQNSTAKTAYASPGKVKLSEQGKTTKSSVVYTHKLTLFFASNDPLRVNRIKEYLKVKYIYITLSTGMVFFFGRNDYFQNAAPKIQIISDEKGTKIQYTTTSFYSMGFTNGSFDFDLSEEFPINFYNL